MSTVTIRNKGGMTVTVDGKALEQGGDMPNVDVGDGIAVTSDNGHCIEVEAGAEELVILVGDENQVPVPAGATITVTGSHDLVISIKAQAKGAE